MSAPSDSGLQPPLLLDTCATLWLASGAPMSQTSRKAITAAQARQQVYISPITAWEIGTLAAKGRITLSMAPEPWFDALLALPGLILAPLSPRILIASTALPGAPPKDPADRIIAATAREHGLVVVTRDGALADFAATGHVRLIRC